MTDIQKCDHVIMCDVFIPDQIIFVPGTAPHTHTDRLSRDEIGLNNSTVYNRYYHFYYFTILI